MSKSSIKSSYVRSEISIAFKKYNKNKNYKILPIILEDIFEMYEYETLDLYLSCFNQLDARNFDYDTLVDKIYEQLNIPLFKMKKFNNYQWNTKIEEERILYQNNLLLKYSKKFFELDILKNRKRILDVGCSNGYNIVDPPNTFFDDCFYMYQESFQAGDRHMGRKLPRLLIESGFKNIQILRDAITSEDFNGEYKEELWDLYFNPFLWNATTPEMFRDIRAFEKLDNYKKLHNKIKGEYLLGNYFITLGIFFLIATKF